MFRMPYFHYTAIDNLVEMFRSKHLRSRGWLLANARDFEDISIDPEQTRRAELELIDYVPLFPGYFQKYYREAELDEYLRRNYDEPRVYNRSFYGSLNLTLREELGEEYEQTSLLLLNHDKIMEYVKAGDIRFFTKIAIKPDAEEYECDDSEDLMNHLERCLGGNGHLYCELDVLDNGRECFEIPEDIERIIVDNEGMRVYLIEELSNFMTEEEIGNINIIVAPLPRND